MIGLWLITAKWMRHLGQIALWLLTAVSAAWFILQTVAAVVLASALTESFGPIDRLAHFNAHFIGVALPGLAVALLSASGIVYLRARERGAGLPYEQALRITLGSFEAAILWFVLLAAWAWTLAWGISAVAILIGRSDRPAGSAEWLSELLVHAGLALVGLVVAVAASYRLRRRSEGRRDFSVTSSKGMLGG